MMDWTDRHCRVLHRLISKKALLYTEMVTTGALIHGDQGRHLDYDEMEHPLVFNWVDLNHKIWLNVQNSRKTGATTRSISIVGVLLSECKEVHLGRA